MKTITKLLFVVSALALFSCEGKESLNIKKMLKDDYESNIKKKFDIDVKYQFIEYKVDTLTNKDFADSIFMAFRPLFFDVSYEDFKDSCNIDYLKDKLDSVSLQTLAFFDRQVDSLAGEWRDNGRFMPEVRYIAHWYLWRKLDWMFTKYYDDEDRVQDLNERIQKESLSDIMEAYKDCKKDYILNKLDSLSHAVPKDFFCYLVFHKFSFMNPLLGVRSITDNTKLLRKKNDTYKFFDQLKIEEELFIDNEDEYLEEQEQTLKKGLKSLLE